MEQDHNIDTRSDDVQEILSTPPSWMVRWGTLMMIVALALLLVVCWKWKYADEVVGQLELTTTNPPELIVAQQDGKITRLFVKERMKIEKGAVLAVIQNHANYDDVIILSENIDSMQVMNAVQLNNYRLPANLDLGDLQKPFLELKRVLTDFQKLNSNSTDVIRINKLRQQQAGIDADIEALIQQKNKAIELKKFRENNHETLKVAYSKEEASLYDLQQNRAAIKEAENQISRYNSDINTKKREKQEIALSIREVENNSMIGNTDKLNAIFQNIENLKTEVELWKRRHILYAPIAGEISLEDYWKANKFLRRGEPVMAILTDREEEILAKAVVPLEFAGQVESGQKVHLKLASYPSHRYGFLYGTVATKRRDLQTGDYIVNISLDKGMISSHNEELTFESGMTGTAEIITEERSVLSRLFGQVSKLFS